MPEEPEEARGVEFWLAPYFRDESLWPVLAVVAIIFGLFGATGIALALDRNPFAGAAIVLAFWMSLDASWRARRAGGSRWPLALVAAFWTVCLAGALAMHRFGWMSQAVGGP